MQNTKAISIKNLRKEYKTHKRSPGLGYAIKSLFKREYELKEALKSVSFEIEQGEIVGLIGPNGAGKSTTIKVLSGILYPTSGDVNVLGYVPWEERVDYIANVGVVFGQKEQLVWDLPAVDSFELNKEIYAIPNKAFKKRLKFMIDMLDLEHVVKTPVRDMSLGERMKCKLVAALLHKPKLVFLDEPSIGLDVIAKDTMREFILETNKKFNTTFIVTTHDMEDIERLCNRVIIINHGIVVYDGALKKIKDTYFSTKVIDVKCLEGIDGFNYKGCTVLQKDKYEIKIEIDLKQTTIKDVISHIINKYECADMMINDPPIEKIIQKIFKAKEGEIKKT